MPRRRSSAKRSGSMPVSARTSVDLPWSTCPAVATTYTASAGEERPALPRARAASACGGTHRRSSRQRPSATRATTAGLPARSGSANSTGSATAQPGSCTPGAPPPPITPTDALTLPPTASASATHRARRPSGSAVSDCQVGVSATISDSNVAVSAATVSLSMRSARASGWRRSVPMTSAAPNNRPACGPPSSLSALHGDHRGALAQRRRDVGLVGQQRVGREQPAAEIGDHRHRQGGQLGHRHRAGEALDAEVAGMHLEHGRGVRADRCGVVGARDPVRGADLAQPGAAGRDEVGEPEAVADLDHLAAADDDLATRADRGRGEHQRGGAVVDRERRLGRRAPPAAARRPDPVRVARAVRSPGRTPRRRTPSRRRARRSRTPRAAPGPGSCAGRHPSR